MAVSALCWAFVEISTGKKSNLFSIFTDAFQSIFHNTQTCLIEQVKGARDIHRLGFLALLH